MSPLSTGQLVAAAIEFFPAILFWVWATIGRRGMRERFPEMPWYVFHPAALLAVHYALSAVLDLVPPEVHGHPPVLLIVAYGVSDLMLILSIPAFRHVVHVFMLGNPPDRAWLARNYGWAVLMSALCADPRVIPLPTLEQQIVVYKLILAGYCVAYAILMWEAVRRVARPGSWHVGGLGGPRSRDVLLYASGIVLLAGGVTLVLLGRAMMLWPLIHAGIGLSFLVPTMVLVLGTVVRAFLVATGVLAMTAATYLGFVTLTRDVAPALRPAFDFLAVLSLVLVLVPGQEVMRAMIDRVVFGRRRARWSEVQALVRTLSPELGVVECCRRVLEALVHVMQLRGAAIVLRDGTAVTAGRFVVDRLRAVWPAAVDTVPGRIIVPGATPLPPAVHEALEAADAPAAFAIASPRLRWGHIFITTSLLGAVYTDEDLSASGILADELALVLDGAELLARAVAVERSLAHAGKLAAIGETAARIAHEIRNPVTAARSLAQQLAREQTPFHEEHTLILAELERVERQVSALLRFARREEFKPEAVDLGELVRVTADAYRARLAERDVDLALDLPDGIVARADREKLRQVLVNLIDNALDALAGANGDRRLALAVGGVNGSATMRVADSGPGVPADALPHLFEPFFSLKQSGTGLGLAIARRTVEAHGGRIAATPVTGGGLAFEIELPAW